MSQNTFNLLNMNIRFIIPCLFACTLLFSSCDSGESSTVAKASLAANSSTDQFADYWYAGEAEISSYSLEQVRYGETRRGDAVLVFVTEPFSKSKQVKLDYPEQAGDDKVTVMKLNHIRKFNTGIYDYSMMTSTFTPVQLQEYPHSLKNTTTVQEWCGHTFTQYNLDDEEYAVQQFSYFESEGDIEKEIDAVLLEDEIWNRLRINPESIPTGQVDIIPGTFFIRFAHENIRPTQARISRKAQGDTSELKVEYLHHQRTLTINFETDFPHQILSWTEAQGDDLTRATRKQSIKNAYWAKNSNKFQNLRDTLQLIK